MRRAREMTRLHKRKRLVHAFAAAVLAGSLFLGTGVTAEAAKVDDVIDTQAYANRYPDLFAAFGNNSAALLKHYKEKGISEKREVDGLLDVVRYREANPDLDAAFGDNWDAYVNHYLQFGAKEGRNNYTSFDVQAYAERYPDLKEAFGDDVLALYQHYQAHGKEEGRVAYAVPETVDNVSNFVGLYVVQRGGSFVFYWFDDEGKYDSFVETDGFTGGYFCKSVIDQDGNYTETYPEGAEAPMWWWES